MGQHRLIISNAINFKDEFNEFTLFIQCNQDI